MAMPANGHPVQAEQIEEIVDALYAMAGSWLSMWQAWTKVVVRQPLGYSAATEAANLLARAGERTGTAQA